MTEREKFLESMKEMKNADVKNSPVFITALALRNNLKLKHFTPKQANIIVYNIKIEVNDNFVNDDELFNETIEAFTSAIIKLHEASVDEMMDEYIYEASKQMSLTYTL